MMLCIGNMDNVCGCLTKPQMVTQSPDKPSLIQNSNSMRKTASPGRANWNMSFFIAFRTILCLLRNPFFAIFTKFPFHRCSKTLMIKLMVLNSSKLNY